jgi:HEAT repeat protein
MGFDLDAFLGRASELNGWSRELPTAVVCPLSRELAMVPLTGELQLDLDALGESHLEFAARASRRSAVAYVNLWEFGDDSDEKARLWSGGKEILTGASLREALDHLQNKAGLDFDWKEVDLERERGESAAERWAAKAIVEPLAADALIGALRCERKSKTLQNAVRNAAARRLAALGPAAAAAVPALEAALRDPDYALRLNAASALGAMGRAALPVLLQQLQTADRDILWAIIKALGGLGRDAQDALPALRNILAGPAAQDYHVRTAAEEAIPKISSERTAP